MAPDESLLLIAERTEQIRTIMAAAELVLIDADGQSVRLDAALVAAPPDRLRIRAWKFGRAVLDVAVVEGELWFTESEDPAIRARLGAPEARLGPGLARIATLFDADLIRAAIPIGAQSTSHTLVAVVQLDPAVRCWFDRATLTLRRVGPETVGPGDQAYVVEFASYGLVDGVPWPSRVDLTSEQGRIRMKMYDVELNAELPSAAFVPPRRAGRQR